MILASIYSTIQQNMNSKAIKPFANPCGWRCRFPGRGIRIFISVGLIPPAGFEVFTT
jgi:hypothetical protein